jgi:hypothetical protein
MPKDDDVTFVGGGAAGKSAFKAKTHPLGQTKCLRQSGGDGSCARTLQNTDSAVSNGTRGNRIEVINVEHAPGCGVRDIAIAHAIGPLEHAAIGETEIAGIVTGTGDGCEDRGRC